MYIAPSGIKGAMVARFRGLLGAPARGSRIECCLRVSRDCASVALGPRRPQTGLSAVWRAGGPEPAGPARGRNILLCRCQNGVGGAHAHVGCKACAADGIQALAQVAWPMRLGRSPFAKELWRGPGEEFTVRSVPALRNVRL